MPNSVTMRRATLVAFSMSFDAPVVISPKTSSSAAWPPSMPAILSSNSALASAGSGLRPAGPACSRPPCRGDDADLVHRVALGRMRCTTAWPPSW